ncbi:alpha carbonic anhydrase 1, chloroplastic [Ricinus communis]|uniref:alpha carbonic anhydrase 1, chloroplastic n=1 Tax=Ricinus communis TaxID=3988 RepID=UPI00201ADFD8|nr:alpha carbonic anhydrase 1, chloroplastic [Ricinus communis]
MTHRRISFFPLLVTLLFLAIAPARNIAGENSVSTAFGYHGSNGPSNWGKLNPNFTSCGSGKLQSPININRDRTVINKNLKPLLKGYKRANATLATNGAVVGVHYESDCGGMNINNKMYALKQMHWHSPSEHMIDGIQYPLELHMVHQLGDGSYSVIAILYQYGEADPYLAQIEKSLDQLAEEVNKGGKEAQVPLGIINPKILKRSSRRFFRYVGSLTTPPCTEDVIWNIIPTVRTVSKNQVRALKAPLNQAYKNNCRPLQSLNGRKVEIAPRADA